MWRPKPDREDDNVTTYPVQSTVNTTVRSGATKSHAD